MKKVSVPVSEQYIRERIDIDSPLSGFQIRDRFTGYLQGFVTFTTFTTWSLEFMWCSSHPQSGMVSCQGKKVKNWDVDNKIGSRLQMCDRGGDPKGNGVVWREIGEISLLGSLGCGDLLMSLAIEKFLSSDSQYKFLVLSATPSSKGYYERFGFVRVGAVAKYESSNAIVGYRHWTYVDEKHLMKHGGPSYMMALDLEEVRERNFGGKVKSTRNVRKCKKTTTTNITTSTSTASTTTTTPIMSAISSCVAARKPKIRPVSSTDTATFERRYNSVDSMLQNHKGFHRGASSSRAASAAGDNNNREGNASVGYVDSTEGNSGGDKRKVRKRRKRSRNSSSNGGGHNNGNSSSSVWIAVPLTEPTRSGPRKLNKYTSSKLVGDGVVNVVEGDGWGNDKDVSVGDEGFNSVTPVTGECDV